jgi:hypothetical protein
MLCLYITIFPVYSYIEDELEEQTFQQGFTTYGNHNINFVLLWMTLLLLLLLEKLIVIFLTLISLKKYFL